MTIALWQRPLARIVMGIVKAGNGAWFDPSDLSTLYQDAAGTKPVTAVEQPVGLMLDKSQGLMLGPELASNGTFDSDTGWTKNTGITISGGTCNFLAVAGGQGINQSISQSLSTDKKYLVEFEISAYSSGNGISVRIGNVGNFYTVTPSNGKKKLIISAGSAKGFIQFLESAGSGTYSIDNISVRELYGYHATQSVTASRPVLSARKNILLATETLATQSVTTLAAQYTLSFTGTGSVTLSGAATGTLTGTGTDRVSLTFTPTAGTLTLTVSGSVTKAQVELGTSAGPYQRVNTATDYDTDERYFKKYLRFDGVDDYLVLPYMGLYAGGSASVVVGLKSIDVTGVYSRLLAETSSSDSNSRYILLREDLNIPSIDATIVNSSGTPLVDTAPVPQTNGESSVISVVDTGSRVSLFKNTLLNTYNNYIRSGVVSLTNTTLGAQLVPTNTYNAYTASQLYSLIITKSALTDAQRIKCERYAASKAGVIL